WLCRAALPFTVRIPLVPGVTDTEENYRGIAEFFSGSESLQEVQLLPYNTLAGAKYPMVNREYRPDFDGAVPVRVNRTIFENHGIRSVVL
ncbi:MAG: hypothetical protein LBG42_01525, partial [Treponema sp.]|nr:hypothetical protein [Treponema sp.]